MEEAKRFTKAKFVRARGIRNGLMLALWTLAPSRRKNFATLEIGKTFRQVHGKWWITIEAKQTKSRRRPEERPIADWLTPFIELYLKEARPVLLTGSKQDTNALWISSGTRGPMTTNDVGALITQITWETLGVAISPHLFRTVAATAVADAKGDMPHLASALLGHAANEYAAILDNVMGAMKSSPSSNRHAAGLMLLSVVDAEAATLCC